MRIKAGYDICFQCPQETAMVLMLSVHPGRQHDLLSTHTIQLSPAVTARDYLDSFGNICTRLVAPPGLLEVRNRFVIHDSGMPDEFAVNAERWPIERLPDEVLVFLLGSRYCDTQKLSDIA